MSRPHRASDGCIISTSGNRYTNIPFYLKTGPIKEEFVDRCPTHCKRHIRLKLERELSFPFVGIVGVHVSMERGSSYLIITKHKNLKYFPFNDIYCEECEDWHFKGFR